MDIDKDNLPNDPALLKQMLFDISDNYEDKLNNYENELKHERFRYRILEEKYLTLQRRFFGRRSEKLTGEEKVQMLLFNEPEDGADDAGDIPSVYTAVKGYTRTKPGRKPLPKELPREEVIHDLSPEEKRCACCSKERPCIGKEESEELDIIPAQIRVIKHIRLKYGPCDCDGFLHKEIPEIKTASLPERIIPQGIVSPGLLAYVIVSKYADSLPFYRQEKIFERIGVDISRATLCNWAILAAERCVEIIVLLKEDIREGPLIQMDETTVQVLHEQGRAPETKSYMWVAVGYHDSSRPIILYEYHTSRSHDIPLQFLEGYTGFLQSDGYAGYNKAGDLPGITHVGCFAHARRSFYEASKLSKKSKAAYKGVSYIKKVYQIENDLRERNLSPEQFVETRKKQAQPVLEDFHNWLMIQKSAYPPESKIGKAINYSLNEWSKLIKYLDVHFLTPDNNIVENAIRPFVVGRKNWLFSNTPRGAHASAALYSLIESAKANKLEPYRYLRYLFTYLPQVSSKDKLRKLLPYHIRADDLIIR